MIYWVYSNSYRRGETKEIEMRTIKLQETRFTFSSESELALAVQLDGCVYHRDSPDACDGANGTSWYIVAGDLWCEAALLEFTRTISLDTLDAALIDFDETPAQAPQADEIYGCTGDDARWIRDNVGLD